MKSAKRLRLLKEHNGREKYYSDNRINIIKGTNNILISAPHGFIHHRKGKRKFADMGTNNLVKLLAQKTNCSVIYTTGVLKYDPNYDKDNLYKKLLVDYIKKNKIKYLIDLHGMKKRINSTIDIGTNNYKNVNNNKEIVSLLIDKLHEQNINQVTVDSHFKSRHNTVSKTANLKAGICSIQIEAGRVYRNYHNKKHFDSYLNALIAFIYNLERIDNMTEKNFTDSYDQVLDIKPSFGYERKLSNIAYNQVGMEIEVSVTYEREKYSFLKTLIKKIKNIVGDNGYFVKDATIKGDYGFEIVLDPLKVEEIYKIYSQLLKVCQFSQGLINISKEYDCGIHLNFNQYDIADKEEAHKKLTSLFIDNPKYFEQNIYKQFKFIWDFDEYLQYQHEIGAKYLWVNYLDTKLVEIRNIRSNLTAEELVEIIKQILGAIFYDRENTATQKIEKSLKDLYQEIVEHNCEKIVQALEKDQMLIFVNDNGNLNLIRPSKKIKEYLNQKNSD